MSKVKTDWNIDVNEVKRTLENLDWNQPPRIHPPTFLREWKSHFRQTVLRNLLILKQSILSVKNPKIRDLFRLALVSILVDCSNLKRSPCLGYVKDKDVPDDAPFKYFAKKVEQIIDDLKYVQGKKQGKITIITGDARTVTYEPGSVNIAITSPPYVNGLDYIINYKIEMAWLDMVNSYEDLRQLKNEMVACDNISRNIIRDFSEKSHTYTNNWIEEVTKLISRKIAQKKGYRREDMHLVVRKYFDDIHPVLGNVYDGLEEGGRFIIVIGDSLMAGVYIPADLIIAKMGKDVGFEIEGVEVARQRRSGQRRSFRLRESIVVLRKGKRKRMGLEGYIYPR